MCHWCHLGMLSKTFGTDALFLPWLGVLKMWPRAPHITCRCAWLQLQKVGFCFRWSRCTLKAEGPLVSEAEPGLHVAALQPCRTQRPVTPQLGVEALAVVKATPAGALSWQQEHLGGLRARRRPVKPTSDSNSLWSTTDSCFQGLVSWAPAVALFHSAALWNGPRAFIDPEFSPSSSSESMGCCCLTWCLSYINSPHAVLTGYI